jgi:Xaa-Pro aminopeptidase
MLTAEGCRARRQRLLDALKPAHPLLLADPIHLRYFANFHVEAISQHADFGGLLVLRPDGRAELFHDSKLPKSVELAHADERTPVVWYSGQEPQDGERRMLLRPVVDANGGRVHDSLADKLAPKLFDVVGAMRRRKDPDEIELLKTCMRATDAGHAWARTNIKPGMLELGVYAGVGWAVDKALGHWAIVYGDFAVTSGTKRGGPPSTRVLKKGETFIVDYSVVVQGYRSDFTNTLIVGGEPTDEQQRLFGLCVAAMSAGESELRAGAKCQVVYDAILGVFEAAGVADYFMTHAGHGLGIMHPEPPYIVRHSTETLVAGDVVTLEPGLYTGDIGIRIEHNYRITDTGYERLSNHIISLT